MLPFLMRAIVLTMPSFPQMNARFDDEKGIEWTLVTHTSRVEGEITPQLWGTLPP